ncbi:monosaccharide ABC transporter ATP-binding protein (CUT2 family) [Marinisporobacter balticus]|uniref:Ribose/galactose/methyl galactoside import ATP-binding protein n=2 Tax=Marinisporobacter balticus TaxID=2018667 RepID=A0A4V2SA29_9FIRM|nr:monosaccharide ABC transporter ATP-binding protein (CUT2 family) [Marinisporobacter balticus]
MMDNDYILEMENITKEFPGVVALDDVQLKVKKGKVHSLMGENGAGKSTLMKTIIGIHQPTKGKIKWKGQEMVIENTNHALSLGISMIHQELSPIPYMTVAENIFLGREPVGRFGLVDHKKMEKDTKELLNNLEIDINPKEIMANLSIANTQMVEIAKAISYNSDLIIMDEPTSAITEKEVANLFKIIEKLISKGVAIIYITHKMDEVFKISDDITVFRDGKYIDTKPAKELDHDKLVQLMVGRELKQVFHKEKAKIGEVILAVKNLTRKGYFKDVSFEVRRGEIFGIAGLMGAGRTEVMENVFGITKRDSGEIYIKGQRVEINTPEDAIKHKMALLTEDRKLTGIYLMLSVQDNMVVANVKDYLNGFLLDKKKIAKVCEEEIEKLSIKTPSKEQIIGNLSGGNQQKVLISRWLLTQPDILILDEPTRGIDVGAKAEIHKLMSKLAQQGKAVIMISSELPEVLGMSDRIMVMYEGRKTGEIMRGDATQENIMYLATGKEH